MNRQARPARPFGVTLICLLNFGVTPVIVAILLMAMTSAHPSSYSHISTVENLFGLLIFFAILGFIVAVGLYRLKNWARRLHILACGIAIFLNLLPNTVRSVPANGLFSVIINGLVIFYLLQPHVVAAFTAQEAWDKDDYQTYDEEGEALAARMPRSAWQPLPITAAETMSHPSRGNFPSLMCDRCGSELVTVDGTFTCMWCTENDQVNGA